MARKRIGDIEGDIILVGGLLIGGYLLVTKLLPGGLGIGTSAEDQQTVNEMNTVPPNTNPFSYQYQYGLYGQAPTAYGAQWWQALKANGDNNTTGSGGVLDYYVNGEVINNAFGTLVETDQDVYNVFNSLTKQSDVANIAAYIFFNYGMDLMSLLQNGRGSIPFVNNGLNGTHLASLINHVNSLPPQ